MKAAAFAQYPLSLTLPFKEFEALSINRFCDKKTNLSALSYLGVGLAP